MTDLEIFLKRFKEKRSNAEVSVDDNAKIAWIDIYKTALLLGKSQHVITIEYRPNEGFGFYFTEELFSGPEEVYKTIDSALDRLISIFDNKA